MATSNPSLVRDNSTLPHFIQWAQAISNFMATAGWTQTADTGQVNWGTIASVPTVGTFVFEIWQPGDALTPFFLKLEYGTQAGSSNTQPCVRLSIGTSTNGAGTLSGFVTQAFACPNVGVPVSSTTTQFSCFFSGDVSRIGILMWTTDSSNNGPLMFAVQRSLNNLGAPTSDYVTLISIGGNAHPCFQQSLMLASGAGTFVAPNVSNAVLICLKVWQFTSDSAFGGISFSPVFPDIGFFGNPMDQVCVGSLNDFTDSSTITVASANMTYGVAHTYVAAKNPPLNSSGDASGNSCLLMRYD